MSPYTWRPVVLYGVLAGMLIALLRLIEYRWLVLSHSLEIYGGMVAVLFAGLGLWLGRRFMGREREVVRETVVVREVPVPVEVPIEVPVAVPAVPFVSDAARAEALGLTPRELEILSLMAEGLSNREIAERVYLSENTVKTHAARVYEKLGARRRTQAVQLARAHLLIP